MLDLIALIIISLAFVGWISVRYPRYRHLLLLAFILRLLILIVDQTHLFPLLHAGRDTETFDYIARYNQGSSNWIVLTNYSKFLTIFYALTDNSRLLAQFFNILLGMGVIIATISSFNMLGIYNRHTKMMVAIECIMPDMIILSSLLLREAWVQFFVALSVLEFIKWYRTGRVLKIVTTIACILSATYMHSGVIGVAVGYTVAFILYNPLRQRITFSYVSIISLIILCGITIWFSSNIELFNDKFSSYDSESNQAFLNQASLNGSGNAAYLQWLPPATNIFIALAYAPIRMFYFFFSPLPFDWRGPMDLIAFFIDSSFFIYLIYIAYKRFAPKGLTFLKRNIVLSIMIAAFLFSFGTQNSGTAMRHRAKLVAPLCVVAGMSIYKRNPESTKKSFYENNVYSA